MTVLELDRESLLVHVTAETTLGDLEGALAHEGLTLDVAGPHGAQLVGAWLEGGAPGARSAWLDPADHLVAGFRGVVRSNGERVDVLPAPRRAVGPDPLALVLGLEGRFVTLSSVWLRVHRRGVPRPATVEFVDGSAEPLTDDERMLFERVGRA